MTCRLCLEDRQLLRSHIIPEFMYRPLYVHCSPRKIYMFEGDRRVKILQSGVRERLLCHGCEQQFSRYERYEAEAFFRQRFDPLDRAESGLIQPLSNLKYVPLKLFFLSVLWRLSITSIPNFGGAQLGASHTENLRQMLINENPGLMGDYPFVVAEISLNGTPLEGWILPPRQSRGLRLIVWNLTVGRFLVKYFVSSHAPPHQISPMFLRPDGTMRIYRTDVREVPPLMKYARMLARQTLI